MTPEPEDDDWVPAEESGPRRTCLACRQKADRDELIRLVASPGGQLVVDYRGKLPGRGAWLHPQRECLDLLRKRRGVIGRALPGVSTEAASAELIEEQLRARVHEAMLDGLSMAAAAGGLVGGRDVLEQALRTGEVVEVILAADAAERTVVALRAVADPEVPFTVVPVGRDDLGSRIGRGARAALGLRPSRVVSHLRRQLHRLRMLR